MGKNDGPLTPKAIAKKIKAKGLQKTRWYCQMCEKQCRDANGFKCHIESESHLRQMEVLKGAQGRFVDKFSQDFETGMMDIIRRQFRTKRVLANMVYNEYIRDRHHVHMNATRWVTLTGFVMYLGKSGKCKVEETPKGWYLTYIERDPEVLARQAKHEASEKAEKDEEERLQQAFAKRSDAAKQLNPNDAPTEVTELVRDENQKIAFSFKKPLSKGFAASESIEQTNITEAPKEDISQEETPTGEEEGEDYEVLDATEETAEEKTNGEEDYEIIDATEEPPAPQVTSIITNHNVKVSSSSSEKQAPTVVSTKPTESRKRKFSSLDQIMQSEERKKEKINRKSNWITEGIVVKVMNQDVGEGKYYKKKGVIKKVFQDYIALIQMIDSHDVLKIGQDQLETVLPQIGKPVKIVNGAYRGEEATLLEIDTNRFCAKVKISSGLRMGYITWEDYDDICKIGS